MNSLLYPEAIARLKNDLEIAANDWDYLSAITGDGPIREFEREFGHAVGGKHVIACTNATSAILMALVASGVGRGDEVILPSYTWPQTLAPILLMGATPVFADIDSNSVTASKESVVSCLSKKTKAIIIAHLFGIPADINAFEALAQERGFALIYDAAQAFGAQYNERGIGAYGDFVAYSFGRSKLLSVGEGGALVCRTRELYERAIACSQHPLRMHRDIDDNRMRKHIDGVALNFRLHPLVASLALGQLSGFLSSGKLEELIYSFSELRKRITEAGMEDILPKIPPEGSASGVCLPLVIDRDDRRMVEERLGELNIKVTEGGIQTPLHMSDTIQTRRFLCHRGIIRKQVFRRHTSHTSGICPNSERRCSTSQAIIKIA